MNGTSDFVVEWTHSCAECGHRFDGMPAVDEDCPRCGCGRRFSQPADEQPLTMTWRGGRRS